MNDRMKKSAALLMCMLYAVMPGHAREGPLLLRPGYQLSGSVFEFALITAGSQYFYDEWLPAEVVLLNGETVKDSMFRYNGFLDELIWLPSLARKPVQVDKGLVRRFSLNMKGTDNIAVFENVSFIPGFADQGFSLFAQPLFSGHSMLYVHWQIRQHGVMERSDGGKIYHLPLLRPGPVYYLVMPEARVVPIRKISNRAFLDLFSDMRREVRKVLRQRHIRVRSEPDLIRAIEAVDHLFSKIDG